MPALKAAFTFIEIMVVMALIGVMAAFVLPRFTHRTPATEWPIIIDELNNLVTFARHEAMTNHKNYRLAFAKNKQVSVTVEEEVSDQEHPSKKIFVATTSYYLNPPQYTFDDTVALKAFFNKKTKILTDDEKGAAFCYIIPNGLVQPVSLHLFHKNKPDEQGITITLEPFSGTFSMAEGFIKP